MRCIVAVLSSLLSLSAFAQEEGGGPPQPSQAELEALLSNAEPDPIASEEGCTSCFPSWNGVVASANAAGILNATPGSNPRPLSLGVGYSYWSEFAELVALAQVAPAVADAGPDAPGTLLRAGGGLGLNVTGRLHRLHARRELPLTVGAYLGAGASLDSAGDASWTGIRAGGGLALHWWPVASTRQLVYLTAEAGPLFRHRTGAEGGTWLGLSTGVSLTVRSVSAGLTMTHVPAGSTPMPGLTGTRVSAGLSIQADLLPL